MSCKPTIAIAVTMSIVLCAIIAFAGWEVSHILAFDWRISDDLVQTCNGSGMAHDCHYAWAR